ncbi:MAG: hypothetical protein KF819_29320 [Labilithrix sp.]|nr:hypothetical protein [Labilithrix sp.]
MSRGARVLTLAGLVVGLALAVVGAANVRVAERAADEELCAARVGELRLWLHVLAQEGEVRPESVGPEPSTERYVDRPLPRVALVQLREAPSPLPAIAFVSLGGSTVRFGDSSASIDDRDAVDRLMKRAGASALTPTFGFGRPDAFMFHQPVVLFVAAEARWSEVTTLVDRATRAGFTSAYFVFAVKSGVPAPPPSPRIVAIASDPREVPYAREQAAARELARLNPACPGVGAPLLEAPRWSGDAHRAAFVARAADEVAACNCRVDLAAIKTFAWVRFGRHWGSLTVSHEIEITNADRDDGSRLPRAEEVAAPADKPWSETHAFVLDAANRKARVILATYP